jgi:hypothetical protein
MSSQDEKSEYGEDQDSPNKDQDVDENVAVGGHHLYEECRGITLDKLTKGQKFEHHHSFRSLTECSRTCDLCLFLLEVTWTLQAMSSQIANPTATWRVSQRLWLQID